MLHWRSTKSTIGINKTTKVVVYGKIAVLNLAKNGRQIGEKWFALLSVDQQRELTQFILTQFILEETTGRRDLTDIPYQPISRGKYFAPKKRTNP